MNLALFDLDGTLLEIDSDHAFGEFMVALGWVDAEAFRRRNDAFYDEYQAGAARHRRLHRLRHRALARARPRRRSLAMRERFMREVDAARRSTSARCALVRRHQAAGDRVAIVTATNEFITRRSPAPSAWPN